MSCSQLLAPYVENARACEKFVMQAGCELMGEANLRLAAGSQRTNNDFDLPSYEQATGLLSYGDAQFFQNIEAANQAEKSISTL